MPVATLHIGSDMLNLAGICLAATATAVFAAIARADRRRAYPDSGNEPDRHKMSDLSLVLASRKKTTASGAFLLLGLMSLLTVGCTVRAVDRVGAAASSKEFLAMIKGLTDLTPAEFLRPDIVISTMRIPLREDSSRRGANGIARYFFHQVHGAQVQSVLYWYRDATPQAANRAYVSFLIDSSLVCISRQDIERVFGNVWSSGLRHELMPGVARAGKNESDPHYGLMSYRVETDRVVNFSFRQGDACISNVTINEGANR